MSYPFTALLPSLAAPAHKGFHIFHIGTLLRRPCTIIEVWQLKYGCPKRVALVKQVVRPDTPSFVIMPYEQRFEGYAVVLGVFWEVGSVLAVMFICCEVC